MTTALQEIFVAARAMKGEVLATALFQREGNMHIVLVHLPSEMGEKYCVWTFVQWPGEKGSFSGGDYHVAVPGDKGACDECGRGPGRCGCQSPIFRPRDVAGAAWKAFIKRAEDQRRDLAREITKSAQKAV